MLIWFTKIAFGKTKVVNGIQEIGLTPAIIPTNGSYPLRKRKIGGGVVPKL
jgi:hypothetical protein